VPHQPTWWEVIGLFAVLAVGLFLVSFIAELLGLTWLLEGVLRFLGGVLIVMVCCRRLGWD
jgi:hypothetical protein